MIRTRRLSSRQSFFTLACLVAISAPGGAQETSRADTITRPTPAAYGVRASFGIAHVTSVDEALSPERYGGTGSALGIGLVRESATRRVSAGMGINVSSSLTTGRTAGGLPDIRFIAYDGRVDLQQRLRTRIAGGVVALAGVAIDGRFAQRTHHVATPPGASADPPQNLGQDVIVTLQPTIELARPVGAGAIAYRLGVGVIGAVLHTWAPIGSLNQPLKVQTPPALLLFDNLITAERPVGRGATLGIAYRLRLLRARSPLMLAESRSDLALSVAWRHGRER